MDWNEQEMQRALRESIQTTPILGTPLSAQVGREDQASTM